MPRLGVGWWNRVDEDICIRLIGGFFGARGILDFFLADFKMDVMGGYSL